MRVLAIDPGYGRCGMAVIEKNNGREILIHSLCVETHSKDEFPERMARITNQCAVLIDTYSPQAIALEKLYFAKNQKTAMRVAEVRGALINTAENRRLPVFEYTPAQVKNAAAGWGGADKRAVATMLRSLMKIEKEILLDDEYDAIAIGVTHLAHHRQ